MARELRPVRPADAGDPIAGWSAPPTDEAPAASRPGLAAAARALGLLIPGNALAVAVLDDALRFVYVSEALAAMNGVPAAAHLGRTLPDVLPDQHPQLVLDLRRVLETGEPLVGEEITGRTPREPATTRCWRVSCYPVRRGERTVGVTALVEELTAVRQAEAAWREAESRHRAAFEQSPVSTVVYDAAGHPLRVNPAFERLWGARVEDVPPDYSVLTDPQLEAAGVLDEIRRAFRGESVTTPALRYDMPSVTGVGRTLWTQGFLYPVFDAEGRVAEVVLSHRDVTAEMEAEARAREAAAALLAQNAQISATLDGLRASEARYRALVEATTQMVWSTTHEGLVEDMPFWRELTGQTLEEVRGHGWASAVHPDDRAHVFEIWQRAFRAREPYEADYRIRLASGVYRRYRARGVPVLDAQGEVREWVGVFDAVDPSPERARRLLAVARGLGEALTPEDVANTLFRDGLGAVDADAGSLALVRHDAQGVPTEFEIVQSMGFTDAVAARYRRFPLTPGRPLTEATLSGRVVLVGTRDEWERRFPGSGDELFATGHVAYAAVPVLAAGRVVAALNVAFRDPQDFDEGTRTFLDSMSELCAQALVRTELFVAEHRAREEAERLAEAGRLLASSLDYESTIAALVRAVVPGLGDWCAVDVVEEPEAGEWPPRLQRLGIYHRDPAMIALGAEVERRYPRDWSRDVGVARVLRTGEPFVIPVVTDDVLAAMARDAGHLALLRALQLSSVIVVPLETRGVRLGALTLCMTDSGRLYEERDVALAQELAHRAATAVDNARLYREAQRARAAAEAAAERTARLQAVTAALSRALTSEEIADAVLREGLSALDATDGVLCRVAEDGRTLQIVQALGLPDWALAEFGSISVDAPLPLAESVRCGEPLYLENRVEVVERYPALREANARVATEAWAALPLRVDGRVLGALAWGFAEARPFAPADRAFAEALARQCAQALERARLYAAERAAREEANRANEAKTQFLRSMSHELRTPLGIIGGIVDLWEMGIRGEFTAQQREDVSRLKRNQRYLLGLITDVLNLAKIEAGHVVFDLREVPAADVLAEVHEMAVAQAEQRGVQLALTPVADGLRAVADHERLQQILVNLIANALKATPVGGSVTLGCRAEGDRVLFTVADTGVGIPEDKREAIFAPFVQLGRSLTSGHEGTGLGLSISRDLARAMGGDVAVRSELAAGSVFTVSLPRAGNGG